VLFEFIRALWSGDDAAANELVTDTSLVLRAKELGLARTQGERLWAGYCTDGTGMQPDRLQVVRASWSALTVNDLPST